MVRVRRFIPLPSESILEAESTAQNIQPGRHLPGFFYLSRNMQTLSSSEKQRYQRHLMLEEIGEEGQTRIRNASVLVVGAGGLGCPVMQYLTTTGIGRLGLIDDDHIDISNLQRQVFYGLGDIGKMKSIVATSRMQEMNRMVKVERIGGRLNSHNALSLVSDYDLVADCTDNLETRYLISDACVLADKTMVHGGVFRFEGQVTVFNHKGGPSYRCLYPHGEEHLSPAEMTGIYSIIPGIIGSLQVNEILKVITGTGEVLSGNLLLFHALENRFSVQRFQRVAQNFDKSYLRSITKVITT